MLNRLLYHSSSINTLATSHSRDDGIQDYDLTHLYAAHTKPLTPHAVGVLDRDFASQQIGPRCSVYSITLGLQMAALRNHHYIDVNSLNRLTNKIWNEATRDRDPQLQDTGISKSQAMQALATILRRDTCLNIDFEEVGALTFVSCATSSPNRNTLCWRMNANIRTPIKDLNLQVLGSFIYWSGSDISGLTKSMMGHAVAVHSINFEEHWIRVVDSNITCENQNNGLIVHEVPFEDIIDDTPERHPQIVFYRGIDTKNKTPMTLWNLVRNIPWKAV